MKGVYADQIAMSLSLLNELGYGWQNRITEEIGRCEQTASLVGHLAQDIATAAGDKNGKCQRPGPFPVLFRSRPAVPTVAAEH